MSSTTLRFSDKRCLRTREALERSLFQFNIEHQYSEKLSVVLLCESAEVSTPTFYRHYRGLFEVMEISCARVRNELATIFDKGNSLLIRLTRLFCFVNEHELFYRCNIAQMSARVFEDIAEIIRPKIREFLKGRSENAGVAMVGKRLAQESRMSETDEELCFEIENYITAKLKWWITRDELDEGKIDTRVREILEFIARRIEETKRS